MTPATGTAKTNFFLKASSPEFAAANANGGYADVRVTPPPHTGSNCGQHYSATWGLNGNKATFDLEPGLIYGRKFCKGTYTARVIVDRFGDGSEVVTVAKTTFKVR